jgi:hypothetical protein
MTVLAPPTTAITIAGTSVALSGVEWSVAVSHGRNDVTSAPEPSSAQVVLLIRPGDAIPVDVGDSLVVTAYTVPRFTGTVTDVTIDHVLSDDGTAPLTRVTAAAIGPLSLLGSFIDGATGFTSDTLEDRVTGILDATGLDYDLRTEPGMTLIAEDPNPRTVLTILSELCTATGATLADSPAGHIIFDSYTTRGYDYNPATWAYIAGTWGAALGTWTSQSQATTAAPTAVPLGGAVVLWEPLWRKDVLGVVNDVTVTYGTNDPLDTVNQADSASKAIYGERAVVLDSLLADVSDATRRAGNVITAQAQARWNLQQVSILMDLVDSGDRAAILDLISGDRVLVENLPAPAPASTYLGVVEGWAETYGPDGHTLTLSLSDPRYSYAMLEWIAVPGTLTWAAVDPTVIFADVILPTDL